MRRPMATVLPAWLLLHVLPASAEDWPVLDSRRMPAGKTVDQVDQVDVNGDARTRITTTVHLDNGRRFPVETNSPAYVSTDRSRLLVAGGHMDGLTFSTGGKALLYDGEGRLLRELMSFTEPWLGPGPAVAIEPSGGVWIASEGTLSRFDRDGALHWKRPIPRHVHAIVLSPSAGRAAIAVNTALSPGPSLLLFDRLGDRREESSPADFFHAIEFVDEESLMAVSHQQWSSLRRGKDGGVTVASSGALGGNLVGPHSVTASRQGWFAVELAARDGVSIRVVATATGKTLVEKQYPGRCGYERWRHVSVEGGQVRVSGCGKEDAFTVP